MNEFDPTLNDAASGCGIAKLEERASELATVGIAGAIASFVFQAAVAGVAFAALRFLPII